MAELSSPVERTGTQVLKEPRHVFNGYMPPAPSRSNRPFKRHKVSTFNSIVALAVLAAVSVLYISNIIAVNRLAFEIEELKTTYTKVENLSEILRSEVNRKSSMERITRIASEQMGMIFPQKPPIWLDADEDNPGASAE